VAKFKVGKTHHSGNDKRGIGTFDIDTQANKIKWDVIK
jgi:hypothetical protein